jgi:hypothetical protein
MEQFMSDQTSYADGVNAKNSVAKYADSIIRWGGFFRTVLTVFGWIYLIGGPLIGFAFVAGQQQPGSYFLIGLMAGAIGAVVMFGYRLIFDYMLMKAHQSKL